MTSGAARSASTSMAPSAYRASFCDGGSSTTIGRDAGCVSAPTSIRPMKSSSLLSRLWMKGDGSRSERDRLEEDLIHRRPGSHSIAPEKHSDTIVSHSISMGKLSAALVPLSVANEKLSEGVVLQSIAI